MSEKTMFVCDGCGKESGDVAQDKWIILKGEIVFHTEADVPGSRTTKWIDANNTSRHYCCIKCLVKSASITGN